MPIKPENRHRYPANWAEIRRQILIRAWNRCEGSPRYLACRAANGEPYPVTGSTVVLTVAHLDQQPENNDPENLRALCQRCHLAHDSESNKQKAAATRAARRGL